MKLIDQMRRLGFSFGCWVCRESSSLESPPLFPKWVAGFNYGKMPPDRQVGGEDDGVFFAEADTLKAAVRLAAERAIGPKHAFFEESSATQRVIKENISRADDIACDLAALADNPIALGAIQNAKAIQASLNGLLDGRTHEEFPV